MRNEVQRYLQIFEYYKDVIEGGQMEPDAKLPSIRKGASQFQVSRTTMESAYMLLAAEGYIMSKPQSGYYVTDMAKKKKERMVTVPEKKEKREIHYDFVTSNVDKEGFNFELWRRYMKSALRQSESLLSYGEPQGEEEFRMVLAEYLRENRSVVCTPEQIVIGAGIQSLLHILCPMIKERKRIAFHNPNFVQGIAIFEDYGFEIVDEKSEERELYYISPSVPLRTGRSLTTNERLQLIRNAYEKGQLIIEDDYNSEYQYSQKQVPSIQGLTGGHGVVYMGTFSKMLLPSIRMSFMVLPLELLKEYEKRKMHYNQTASKAEQIAITQFIRDGHLMSQIRKSRKIHRAKSEKLLSAAQRVFGKDADLQIEESGFRVNLEIASCLTHDEVEELAKRKGLLIKAFTKKDNVLLITMTCTNVAAEKYEEAMKLLKECM